MQNLTTTAGAPAASATHAPSATLIAVAKSASGCACASTTEVNEGSCAPNAGSFPRFFAGQLVQPSDLTAIEQRVFFHERLRARHLYGWGVACGFRVFIEGNAAKQSSSAPVPGTLNAAGVQETALVADTYAERTGTASATTLITGATVRVESGYAIDRYGRDVCMPANTKLSLQTLFDDRQSRITKAMGDPWCVVPGCQPTPPTHFCLAVRYKECPQNPVPSYAQQCGTPATVCEYSSIREDVEFRLFGDNEFPGTATRSPLEQWCGVPPRSRTLAAIFARLMAYPDDALNATVPAYDALTVNVENVGLEREALAKEGPVCDDLLHLARGCGPCVDSPWIPIACFTRDGDAVTAADCSVRRVLYGIQELETLIVRLFCRIVDQERTVASAPQSGETSPTLAQSSPQNTLNLLQ